MHVAIGKVIRFHRLTRALSNIQHTRMSSALLKSKAFIGGQWLEADTKSTFEVTNPSTGAVVGTVPDMRETDTEVAIQVAHNAFQLWKQTTAKDRSEVLKLAYKLMMDSKDELAKIVTLENGKPIGEAIGEVLYGASFCEWFAEECRRVQGGVVASPFKTKRIFTLKQPIGVCGMITPWNFPIAMITRKACAALAAGCTVVCKPAEDTPLSALALAEIFDKAGIPPGVFNIVTCTKENAAAVGKTLCNSPLVSLISFTGSSAVGKIVLRQCAETVKKCCMELGGNAPFIVFNSADIEAAVAGAIACKFRNNGQTCICANRFLIQDEIHDAFVAKLADAMDRQMSMGDGMTVGTTQGPLINKKAVEKVERFVNDAVTNGAKVVRGGKRSSAGETFFQSTLLTGITPDMSCANSEIFGPVAGIMRFNTEEEALNLANRASAGLAGYVYTRDAAQMWRMAENLENGIVGVNEGILSTAEAPHGGCKESGLGREGGIHFGIEEYLQVKYVCLSDVSN